MRSSKRRVSSDAQSSTTTRRTSRSVTISRKLLDEKENILRRATYDNRKTIEDSQRLTDVLRDDYFDSGSYRADCIGKPWRSPNLSRRGIHSNYEGSLKSYSGSGEVISSTSWQSTSYRHGEQPAREQDEGGCQTTTDVDRLQTSSEHLNNSNSISDMRTRSMRISEGRTLYEDIDGYSCEDVDSVNSNNNAAQKRGARQITMWKTGAVPTKSSENKSERFHRSTTNRIYSMFAVTGAPVWPLVPCYAAFSFVRWIFSSILYFFIGLRRGDFIRKRVVTSQETNKSESTAMISERARSRGFFFCCPWHWLFCLLLLFPLLYLTASVMNERTVVFKDSDAHTHGYSIIRFPGDCLSCALRFFLTFLVSIKDSLMVLVFNNDEASLPLDPPLSGNAKGFDKSMYDALVKSIRDHSARLVAQEKQLKAQKAMLEGLIGDHKASEKTTANLVVQINKWEGNLKSVQSQLSSLDLALSDLKKLKMSTKEKSDSVGVNIQEFDLLSEQVKNIAAEQEKQKGFTEELKKLQMLIVKLEGHVKEQKEWTVTQLNQHESEFKKLVASFDALSLKDAKASEAQISDSSLELKALSDRVMSDHERLATFESQQVSLQALLADLEKRLGSQTAATRSKESSTDESLSNFAARLQSLEAEQKALHVRVDQDAKQKQHQQAKISADVVNIGSGCTGSGKDCASIAVVQQLIDRALAIFAADRLARPDFALESAGGSIIGTRCTQTYTDRPAVFSLFGIPLFRMSRSPRTVIQPALYPGECWAFSGTKGQLVVRLASDIEVSSITLEHIPKSLSPNGRIDSAPRKFIIKGLAAESDYTGVKLGEFEYLDNGQPLQTFDLSPPHRVFRYVELQILTNHGHAEYTCVYRMRVHGKIVGNAESESEVR